MFLVVLCKLLYGKHQLPYNWKDVFDYLIHTVKKTNTFCLKEINSRGKLPTRERGETFQSRWEDESCSWRAGDLQVLNIFYPFLFELGRVSKNLIPEKIIKQPKKNKPNIFLIIFHLDILLLWNYTENIRRKKCLPFSVYDFKSLTLVVFEHGKSYFMLMWRNSWIAINFKVFPLWFKWGRMYTILRNSRSMPQKEWATAKSEEVFICLVFSLVQLLLVPWK